MINNAPKLLFGTTKTTWGEEINLDRLRRERADRLRQTMKKHNLAVCLLTGPEGAGYATGKWSMPTPQMDYVLFAVEHDPIIWDSPGSYQHLKDVEPWSLKPENWRCSRCWTAPSCGPEVAREQAKLFAIEIEQELEQKQLKGEKLGLFGGFDLYLIGAFRDLGIEIVDASHVVLEARTLKTKDEIFCMKVAVAAADAAWYAIYEMIKPGMTARDLQAAVAEPAYKAGADYPVLAAFWTGPWTSFRGLPGTDRVIQVGDIVYGDIYVCSYLGYHACYYRTFIVGRRPSEKEKDWYKKVQDKQNSIIECIKPGATTADAAKHMTPANEWGYPEEYYGFSQDVCHGVGLSLHEPPIVSRSWSFEYPLVFEPNMVIAVETIVGEPGVGGVRNEDMVVVTEHGAELLNIFPRDELLAIRPIL